MMFLMMFLIFNVILFTDGERLKIAYKTWKENSRYKRLMREEFRPGRQIRIENINQLEAVYSHFYRHMIWCFPAAKNLFLKENCNYLTWERSGDLLIDISPEPSDSHILVENPFAHIRG